ncbi:general secretion pathway protein GspE [Myxococcus landrumensis]|uniref:general secretion pathway protein GspE n=1 Tax=Myxococcus landrumensis TaxID=2813577 RepID=UPI001F509330|nr:general secretion pathway protein GspE [Myxococcus landrumus]
MAGLASTESSLTDFTYQVPESTIPVTVSTLPKSESDGVLFADSNKEASADIAIALPPALGEAAQSEAKASFGVHASQLDSPEPFASEAKTTPAKDTAEPRSLSSTDVLQGSPSAPEPSADERTSPDTPTSTHSEPSIAYLDAAESALGFKEPPDAAGPASTEKLATESWMLGSAAGASPSPSHEDKSNPSTVSTGEGDTSDSLMLEAAGSMLASHGEPSSRDAAKTREGTATEPLDPESVLPLGAVLPGSTGPKPEAVTESTSREEARESSAAPIGHEDAAVPAPKPVTRRAPIELDDLPAADDAPMQLASTWEFVGWQGAEGNGTIGHVAESTWDDRAVDLEGAMPRAEPPAGASTSDLPLASAWDFIQQPWQPHAREPSEVLTALLAAAGAATVTGSEGPAVSADQVLTALDDVSTQGVLGKVLIAYCAGRFQRAFLLGESFGLVRVGHAWGPGSDGPEVSALKVDLDVPSLLVSSLGQFGPSSFDAPTSAQDEAIFSALGGPASHLLVVPIRARGRPVAFIVADSGNTPVPGTTLDELTRVSAKASEVYDRLPASGAE